MLTHVVDLPTHFYFQCHGRAGDFHCSIDRLAMSLKGIIVKYVLLMMFVSALPPMLNLIGLVIIYGMMFSGGLRMFVVMFDMPTTRNLWHLIQTQYMKKKKLRNGESSLNISTSSPWPKPNDAGNAKTS